MTNQIFGRRVLIQMGAALGLMILSKLTQTYLPNLYLLSALLWLSWACWVGYTAYWRCKAAFLPVWWSVAVGAMALTLADVLFKMSGILFKLGVLLARVHLYQAILPLIAVLLFMYLLKGKSDDTAHSPNIRKLIIVSSVPIAILGIKNLVVPNSIIMMLWLDKLLLNLPQRASMIVAKIWDLFPFPVATTANVVLVFALVALLWQANRFART